MQIFFSFGYFVEDDSYVSRNNGIKITPTARKGGSKMFVAQSLPMAVPNFNQRNDDDYEEVLQYAHYIDCDDW